jgi:hypothetical protein
MASTDDTGIDPGSEYRRRRERRRLTVEDLEGRDRVVAFARLLVAVTATVVGFLAYRSDSVSWWWLALPAAAFVTLAIVHDRILSGLSRARRAVAYFDACLARVEDRWAGGGRGGDEFLPTRHPYAADLDLFGEGSLFELLNTARTGAGERILAGWLLAPAPPDEVASRQAAVKELRSRLDLREKIALLGEEVAAGIHPEAMRSWGDAPAVLVPGWERVACLGTAALTCATLLSWWLLDTGPAPVVAALVIQTALALRLRGRVRRVVQGVEQPEYDLEILAGILSALESERFESQRLVELRAALDTEGVPPSRRIKTLARLVDLLNARRNQLFLPVSLLLMWTTQLAFAVENWRARFGPAVGRWIEAVGEIESLCALAGYAFDHPVDPFPEIRGDGPRFDGKRLGHPLIPEGECVRNDVRLDTDMQLLLVSGSNMSGKSTLLRTVGINAVLAQAGAPVRAGRLSLSSVRIGATLRVQDSLREGTSRFYAEITRLRQISDLATEHGAVLFLLDEILHGTNSHDRAIGSEAVVRGLLDRGAIGLVTTHDLALAGIADDLEPRARNVHFEDTFEDGEIVFDYRLRPGIVRKSNALELMRSIGLDV